MPPKVRYSKQAVVDAAYDIARASGLEAVNARAVAAALGCSTQPLFREFQTMEQLRDAVVARAKQGYDLRIQQSASRTDMPPYKAAGMAYLQFAREEPQLFRMLFMCDRSNKKQDDMEDDPNYEYLLSAIMLATGYTREIARDFHLHMWIYAHGLAAMVATSYVAFNDDDLSGLLSLQFEAGKLLAEKRMRDMAGK